MDIRRRAILSEALYGGGSNEEPINIDNYLTIEALEDGLTAKLYYNACEYCIDGDGNWKTLSAGTTTESINSGHTLSFRGNITPVSSQGIGTFTISKKCNLKGNCMSMLFGDNAANNYSLSGKNWTFYRLFYNCANIVSVSYNFLPATTLSTYCYYYMFQGCTSLTTAPELPATTLANYCYNSMFYGCTSLTTAPELPATTLAYYCYSSMFYGCANLTIAPELPATALADSCYNYMFNGCTSLTTAPKLPATTLATACYRSMFNGCSSLTTAPALPASALKDYCYTGMFLNCTGLTTAPKLPATTLANACYSVMFSGCTALTTSPELPATKLVDYCYNNMFRDCTNLTNAPELPATALASNCYGLMFLNCKKLNYIKMLATNISASDCLYNWVSGVASSGTFVKNPIMNSLPTGVSGIPSGWTVVNDGEQIVNTDNYLTIEALEDGLTASLSTNACEYCVDGDGNWKTLAAGTVTESINSGHTLSFRGELTSTYSDGIGTFSISKRCNIKGDCMSMLFGDNAANNYSLSNYYGAFTKLFKDCTNIITCSKTFLKSTTLGYQCYWELFKGCTNLVSIPELPATTLISGCYYSMFNGCSSLQTVPNNLLSSRNLSNNCYSYMFSNCTSLTTAPELPATTLYSHCYFCMFSRCTNLTTAPELPATTLENYCYGSMFRLCTKLNYIKMLATNISAKDCLSVWVEDVASSGTFVKNKNATWDVTGSNGVPSGWTVQNA